MRQFATFFIVGILNTAIDFTIYTGLTRLADVYFVYANIISVTIAIIAGFLMHKRITFKNTDKSRWQFVRFIIVNLLSLSINTLGIYLMVHYLGIFDLLAKLITTAFIIASSFLLQKYWVFK